MRSLSNTETLGFLPNDRKSFVLVCLCLSLVLGLLVRIPYFFIYDFALNDGALFAQMSEAIRLNGYVLPPTVEYNQTQIPLAYPPLAFYCVAFLTDVFAIDVLDVVRYMPLAFNLVTICAFVLLASRLIKSKVILLYTSLFFPLIPRSYEWLIMGGGVTRSIGFFFALIAAYQASRALFKHDPRPFAGCLLFLSMAALSHLEWGITGVVTVSLLIAFRQFDRRSLGLIAGLSALVLIVTSPWWVTVLSRHGLDPFLAARKTSEWDLFKLENILLSLKIFDDGLGAPLSVLAIIGWLMCVARKDWFLPLWLVAIFLTTPRHGPTAGAMPLAILASVGLAQFLIPNLRQALTLVKNTSGSGQVAKSKLFGSIFLQRLRPNYVVSSCIIAVIFLLVLTSVNYSRHTPLVALSGHERGAMAWIKQHTPSKAEFILLSRSVSWEDDRVAEWFPVLSDRKSLTTAQGLEWIPGNVFHAKVDSIKELKRTQALAPNNLAKYVESRYNTGKYVAVFIPNTAPSYGGFLASGHYRVIYDDRSVLVFERLLLESSSSFVKSFGGISETVQYTGPDQETMTQLRFDAQQSERSSLPLPFLPLDG